MKNFFKIIGLTACILIVIALIGLSFCKNEKRRSFEFAADAVNDISVSWQAEELQKRAHPDMLEDIAKSGHPIDEYFNILNKLGVLKTVMECTLIHSGVTDFPKFYLSADYICHGDYENGSATLVIGLRKDNIMGSWQIANFHVDSPIFASLTEKKKQ